MAVLGCLVFGLQTVASGLFASFVRPASLWGSALGLLQLALSGLRYC